MKITIAAAISVDAKLTRNFEPHIENWVSEEDHVHFRGLIESHDTIVFGRGVYEAMARKVDLQPDRLRIVLTHHPEKYSAATVDGQLEFMNVPVNDLVPLLKGRGKEKLLVAGGPGIMTDFLKTGLADEIYLTVEPRIFGTGDKLIDEVPLDIKLELLSSKTLNEHGTVLLHYAVIK